MPSKFGTLVERLVGARVWFAPDGSNLGTVEAPEIIGPLAKPADDADWEDFDLGRVTSAAYDPTTQERQREWFSVEKKKYVQRTDRQVLSDSYNLTMVDYAANLFDTLMFGLGAAIVPGVAQPIFAKGTRHMDGWVRMMRWNEDGSLLTHAEFHVRLTIQDAPNDSSEPGSPVWRIQHLGDATAALETIVIGEEEE